MPVMSTRGSISVRFFNHLVPKPPLTVSYRVATTPGDTGTAYTTTTVTTSSGSYRLISQSSFFDTPGTYTWICPTGVTSISIMGVGGGGGGYIGGGGSGGAVYVPSYPTIPGRGYTVSVGSGGTGGAGASGDPTTFGNIAFNVFTTGAGLGASTTSPTGAGGSFSAGSSGAGVTSTIYDGAAGGDGAAFGPATGYGAGAGAASDIFSTGGTGYGYPAGVSTIGGGAGGGGAFMPSGYNAAGGGGVGLFGQGSNGSAGVYSGSESPYTQPTGGGGGSGGQSGSPGGAGLYTAGSGGKYGGGGGGGAGRGGDGAPGALRIIWGSGRAYPSTNTAETTTDVIIPLVPPRTYQIILQSALFTAPGAYTWICPAGVTSISVMCVGGGGAGFNVGGGGGAYAYIYDYPTTPGQGYLVVVGAGGKSSDYDGIDPTVSYGSELRLSGSGNGAVGYDITQSTYWWSGSTTGYHGVPGGDASYFNSYTTCVGGGGESGARLDYGPLSGGTFATTDLSRGGIYIVGAGLSGTGVRGGRGGDSSYTRGSLSPAAGDGYDFGGGGGAGGNTNNSFEAAGGPGNDAGVGSGGGGGGYYNGYNNLFSPATGASAGGGGGIGIYGIGAPGAGTGAGVPGVGGNGGSGGQSATAKSTGTGSPGGKYGGGGGGAGFLGSTYPNSGRFHTGNNGRVTYFKGGDGGDGVVRIIWGTGRAYPSSNTAEISTTVTF